MSRQSGYYWVKRWDNCNFEPAYWVSECGFWMFIDCNTKMYNGDIHEINETRILAPYEVNDNE